MGRIFLVEVIRHGQLALVFFEKSRSFLRVMLATSNTLC